MNWGLKPIFMRMRLQTSTAVAAVPTSLITVITTQQPKICLPLELKPGKALKLKGPNQALRSSSDLNPTP